MLFALWRGFIREFISLAGLVAAFLLASQFSRIVGEYLNPWLHTPDISNMTGFGLVFVGVLFLSALLGLLAKKLLPPGFTVMDRVLGLLFGAVRGVLYIGLFFLIYSSYADTDRSWMEGSLLAPYAVELGNLVGEAIPPGYPLSRQDNAHPPSSRGTSFFDGGQPADPHSNRMI